MLSNPEVELSTGLNRQPCGTWEDFVDFRCLKSQGHLTFNAFGLVIADGHRGSRMSCKQRLVDQTITKTSL